MRVSSWPSASMRMARKGVRRIQDPRNTLLLVQGRERNLERGEETRQEPCADRPPPSSSSLLLCVRMVRAEG